MQLATRPLRRRLGILCVASVTMLTFTGSPQAAAPAERQTAAAAAEEALGQAATAGELRDATLGYRANGRADSLVTGATAAPPFKKLWTRDFGTVVSAPVAIGDKVFAVVNANDGTEGGPRMMLVGLHAATGKDLWPAVQLEQNATGAGVAYGGGLLYTHTSRGTVAAWDPATGRQKWSLTLSSASLHYPPVWYDGLVYLQNGRGTALALRAGTGARVWEAPVSEWSVAPAVVDASGVWIGFDGLGWHHLDLKTGAELHSFHVPGVWGAYGLPVALGAGAAWTRSDASGDVTVIAYDRKSGKAVRKLPADATRSSGPGACTSRTSARSARSTPSRTRRPGPTRARSRPPPYVWWQAAMCTWRTPTGASSCSTRRPARSPGPTAVTPNRIPSRSSSPRTTHEASSFPASPPPRPASSSPPPKAP